jgi:alkylation response protein AidB-like acyl-CoA dehydrogenase
MYFQCTQAQQELYERTVAFGRALVERVPAEATRALWRACGEQGIQGTAMPLRYGGSGLGLIDQVLVIEALAYASPRLTGLAFAIHAQMCSVQHALLEFGSEAQKKRLLPGLISGERIAAHAITEAGSGSDAFAIATRAVAQAAGGYRINGTKRYITNAPHGDLFVALCSTDPDDPAWGLSSILVERTDPGFRAAPLTPKAGLSGAIMGEVLFEDCLVGDEALLGARGGGRAVFQHALTIERACIMAGALGEMRRQLEDDLHFAGTHRRSGKKIGDYQSVSHRLADQYLRLSTARLMVHQAVALLDRGETAALESAAAKLYASEASVAFALDSYRNRGAAGFMEGAATWSALENALGSLAFSGTSDIQRNIVASLLMSGHAQPR